MSWGWCWNQVVYTWWLAPVSISKWLATLLINRVSPVITRILIHLPMGWTSKQVCRWSPGQVEQWRQNPVDWSYGSVWKWGIHQNGKFWAGKWWLSIVLGYNKPTYVSTYLSTWGCTIQDLGDYHPLSDLSSNTARGAVGVWEEHRPSSLGVPRICVGGFPGDGRGVWVAGFVKKWPVLYYERWRVTIMVSPRNPITWHSLFINV